MKYDELIKDLRICASTFTESCEECSHSNEHGDCYNGLKRSAADAIDELQSQLPRWIPVTERLPNGESDRYLVAYDFMSHLRVAICYYADNLEKVCKYDFAGRTDNGFYAYDDEYGFYEKTDVRYWMPLPEPPKE